MPRANKKLTDRAIREAKSKDRNYFLFDDGGLRLLIRPSGTKVWQYPYKFDGKNNICTLGQYGSEANKIGSAQARILRDEVKNNLSKGINPNQNKRSKKQQAVIDSSTTFQRIAEEWYNKKTWNEKHAKNIKSRLEKDVFPIIGNTPIKDVGIPQTIQILKNIEERGSITVAQRINQYCVEIFDYAISMSICDTNPALGRTKFLKNHKPENRLHLTEKQLPNFLKALYSYDNLNLTALSIKLLLLTLQRPSEVRKARWEEFNFKEKTWYIPQERMKMKRDHLVPLSTQTIEVLETIKTISGDYEFLFPSKISNRQPMSDVSMIKMMKKFSINKMTPHGVRHTGSTILNENNFDSDWIESQLSHVEENKIRGTYNKAKYIKQRTDMMQWWTDYLDKKQKE
jgi:integrase